jgi:hypothetical protein
MKKDIEQLEEELLEEFDDYVKFVEPCGDHFKVGPEKVKSFIALAFQKIRVDEREKVLKKLMKPLEVVLDFVERRNKMDSEKRVTNAAEDLADTLKVIRKKRD